jgi:murein DD-endopeptidase MepM/ murein hydrolase activator NlpD
MFRDNPALRSIFLCLFVIWGGNFFAVSQPGSASSHLDPGSLSSTMILPTLSASASSFDFHTQDFLAVQSEGFLTLPFLMQPEMRVIQGWFYTGWGAHFGVDYINGNVDDPNNWKTFDVLAAADGEACGNCVDGLGNVVWIRHKIGDKVFYTYYGHLATIESFIPYSKAASPVKVTRGQKIGTAGNTGTWYIHLHFGVYNASRVPIDPYDLYTEQSSYYPNPEPLSMGAKHLFMSDPPPDPFQLHIKPPILLLRPR